MPGGVGLFWVGWGKGQGGIEVWHVSKRIIPGTVATNMGSYYLCMYVRYGSRLYLHIYVYHYV